MRDPMTILPSSKIWNNAAHGGWSWERAVHIGCGAVRLPCGRERTVWGDRRGREAAYHVSVECGRTVRGEKLCWRNASFALPLQHYVIQLLFKPAHCITVSFNCRLNPSAVGQYWATPAMGASSRCLGRQRKSGSRSSLDGRWVEK